MEYRCHLVTVLTTVILMFTDWSRCATAFAKILPDLRVDVRYPITTIQCSVKTTEVGYQMSLFCPMVKPDKESGTQMPCFHNCQASCYYIKGVCVTQESLKSISCNQHRTADDMFISTYRVNFSVPNAAGEWFCKYSGQRSTRASLYVYRPPTPPPPVTVIVTKPVYVTPKPGVPGKTSPREHIGGIVNIDPVTKKPPVIDKGGTPKIPDRTRQHPKYLQPSLEVIRFARADYVIAILSLLSVSLLINIAFCIRCILAKCYISYKKKHKSPPGCLAHCLCVGTIQVERGESLYEEVGQPGVKPPLPPSNRSNTTHTTLLTNEDPYERPTAARLPPGVTITRSQTMPHVTHGYNVRRPSGGGGSTNYLYLQATDPGTGEQRVQRVIVYDDVPLPSEVGDSDRDRERELSASRVTPSPAPSQEADPAAAAGGDRASSPAPGGPTSAAAAAAGGGAGAGGTSASLANSLAKRRLAAQNGRSSTEPGIPEEVPFIDTSSEAGASGAASAADGDVAEDEEDVYGKAGAPKNSARLELSRMMLKKADTLLREANTLLQE